MDYQTYEREVNLKRMFFAVLYQWRKLLVFAVIFAMLLGGFKGVKSWKSATDPEAAVDRAETYQAALEEYQQKKETLELQIEKLQDEVEEHQAYLENSVLMTMDPRSFFCAETSFYISNGYEIMPGMEYQSPDDSIYILSAYIQMLTSSALLSTVAEEAGMELQYLEELIHVSGDNDRILTVRVNCNDEAGARMIQSLLLMNLEQIRERIAASIGEHTLETLMDDIGPDIDLDLVELQKAERERLQDNLDTVTTLQAELEALKEPVMENASKREALKQAAVFGVLGCIVGALLVCLGACAGFVFGDRVYSGSELYGRYGLRILGVLSCGGKNRIDRWLSRIEGRPIRGDDDAIALTAANIRQYCPGAQTIMLTGCAGEENISMLAESLKDKLEGVKLLPCGSVLEDALAVRTTARCDAVVLVEKAGLSCYSNVEHTCRKLADLKKTVVGCIVFE